MRDRQVSTVKRGTLAANHHGSLSQIRIKSLNREKQISGFLFTNRHIVIPNLASGFIGYKLKASLYFCPGKIVYGNEKFAADTASSNGKWATRWSYNRYII